MVHYTAFRNRLPTLNHDKSSLAKTQLKHGLIHRLYTSHSCHQGSFKLIQHLNSLINFLQDKLYALQYSETNGSLTFALTYWSGLVTVAIALVPEAIAFSIIAGVDPKVGLYASFLYRRRHLIFCGRPCMISAATGAMAVVMVTLVRDHGLEYLFAATVLTYDIANYCLLFEAC